VKILILILTTISCSVFAQIELGCKDPQVILTLRNIPCKQEIVLSEDFDIPELEIDFEDTELIFERENEEALGADSSGGGRTTPSASTQRVEPVFQTPFSLTCQATLVSDGQKKYQIVSEKNFKLTNSIPSHFITFKNHFLRDTQSSDEMYPLPSLPSNLNTSGYFIKMAKPDLDATLASHQASFELCRLGMNSAKGTLNICTEKIAELDGEIFNLKLKTQSISMDKKLTITQSIEVICKNETI
tara:strand:+ start:1810 stop:2541 length:732 start_codon:yes stop_codon:yes gene_type:complete